MPGLAACCPMSRPPQASTDRLDLTRATRANLSPVWGLSLAPGLSDVLAEPGEEVARVLHEDEDVDVEHVVERVDDKDRNSQTHMAA